MKNYSLVILTQWENNNNDVENNREQRTTTIVTTYTWLIKQTHEETFNLDEDNLTNLLLHYHERETNMNMNYSNENNDREDIL